jgi:hypothetical protein
MKLTVFRKTSVVRTRRCARYPNNLLGRPKHNVTSSCTVYSEVIKIAGRSGVEVAKVIHIETIGVNVGDGEIISYSWMSYEMKYGRGDRPVG